MSACEKCWRDANERAMHLGGSVVDRYQELLNERREHPCTEAEQRGAVAALASTPATGDTLELLTD